MAVDSAAAGRIAHQRTLKNSIHCSGVALHTAVWDAGYSGRGMSLMVVYNPAGFRLERDARICQLVFHALTTATADGYAGAYQHEGAAAD